MSIDLFLSKYPISNLICDIPSKVRNTDHPILYSSSFKAHKFHWIGEVPPELETCGSFKCLFKYQHVDPLRPCRIIRTEVPDFCIIELEEELRALTPGQTAVFYTGDHCLGGAQILEPIYKDHLQPFIKHSVENG